MKLLALAATGAAVSGLLVVNVALAQPGPAPAAGPAAPAAPAPAPAYAAPPEPAPPPVAAQPPAPAPAAPAAAPPPVAAAPQQEPTIYVAQPPLPPLYPRTRLRHDGFYLRLNGGFGYSTTKSTSDGSSAEFRLYGATAGLDLLIGGTPAPGLVLGGGFFLQGYLDPGTSRDGEAFDNLSKREGAAHGMIGPFIDVFPNPYGGFHFGGTLALAATSLRGYDDKGSAGLGVGIWAGYMGWVSSEWSVGGLLKFTGVWTAREVENGARDRVDVLDASQAVQFMFSAAYH